MEQYNLKDIETTCITLRSKLDENIRRRNEIQNRCKRCVSENSPLVITFAGKFKTGKSSLINAILGIDLLPTKSTTATAVVTKIVKGKENKAWLVKNGNKKQISVNQAKDIILNQKVENLDELVEVIFEVNVRWLSDKVEIRDTPGMQDSAQNGLLEEVTLRSLDDTDICVCVYNAAELLNLQERNFTLKVNDMLSGNVLYAVNCINRLNSQDNLERAKSKADNFFKTVPSDNKAMGRRFMMCSAPGNLFLDGFDVWFKTFAGDGGMSLKNSIRKISSVGHIKAFGSEYLNDLESNIELLGEYKNFVTAKHESELKKKKDELKNKTKGEVQYIKENGMEEALKIFTDISGLEQELSDTYSSSDKMSRYSDYSDMCQKITKNFLKDRYLEVCKKWENWKSVYNKDNVCMIEQAVDALSFPDKHFYSVEATSGEKWGTAAVFGGIGFLIGGPWGAAIGAAAGRAIGGADSTKDNSISNTMSFIRNTVMPDMRRTFERMIRNGAEKYETQTMKQSLNFTSGYENVLTNLIKLKEMFSAEKSAVQQQMK